ncbi:Uncharacterized conserved protein, Ntn-hydrolase superfamily [Caloramator quimbayensis]|uniref:Uncharacterized conserved protein, Ntn-hydrolase superfamily n=1 Tax=Caloramator quimbayensis TaxID=1147123 RepID=A0A1T4YEC2_9CLOT|nr:DUF1028 domain-containing protein [Caloramator quimbayensis]SKA99661.1 Uncharacterized conserved protein, Ntn-hydrolase superfamily [Caloramator quimbayensis]
MRKISTFSIVARDAQTGELGIGVQSKFLAVGSAVPWAKAGVGAIATQALANLDYGEIGLKLLEKGYSAQKTLDALLSLDDNREDRQIGIVDSNGNSAAFTGRNCFNWAGHITGPNFSCQGNILVSEETIKALADTFNNTQGSLARRIVTALDAAQNAGGDRRGRQSAALLVVKEKGSYGGYNDRYIDLRVDDDPYPIKKLIHLLDLQELYFNKTKPEEMIKVNKDVARQIQEDLKKLGFYEGDMNGIYDEETKNAYRDFCGVENFEERICEGDVVDCNVLKFLNKKAYNS